MAYTCNDYWVQLHKLGKNESRTQDGEPVYLTQAAIDHLHDQLSALKRKLPMLALEAQRTAAYGDRSDNAEYKQAKGALRHAHRQIFTIESQLRRAVVIAKPARAAGIVALGSTVVIESKEGMRKTFEILGPHETNPAKGRISHLSPLGSALISHKANDIVTLKTPDGPQTYKIIDVN